MTTAEKIDCLLRKQGMKQRELAERVGVSEVTISRYVHGERFPKTKILIAIAKELHTTTDYLIGQESEISYESILMGVRKHAKDWTSEQKKALVNAIFDI